MTAHAARPDAGAPPPADVDSSTLLMHLLACADDAIVMADPALNVVMFNDGAQRLFGHAAQAVMGRPLNLLLPAPLREVHDAHMRRFAAEGGAARRASDRADVRGLRADGSQFEAEASIAHMATPRGPYYVVILRDVTQRRAQLRALADSETRANTLAAQAESQARERSVFLAHMSHEIRTPLNAVVGMTQLLLDMPMSDEQRDIVQAIGASGEALRSIVDDLLDFSKVEAGKLEIDAHAFDLRLCIEEALDLVTHAAQPKSLNLAYAIEDGTPEMLVGDAARVRQILVNLLSNAVKFTHDGEVVVHADAQRQVDGEVVLRLAVRDTGVGIAADQLPRLFHAFSQGEASTSRRFGGTGLGLAISRRLAELMGGSLVVESTPGKGSVFTAELHLRAVDGPSRAPDWLEAPSPLLLDRRLLIVDASQTNRRLLMRLGQRWGMRPTTVPSAPEALDRLEHGDPVDVMLIDAGGRDDIDALALVATIRRQLSLASLPVVLLAPLGRRSEVELAVHGQAQVCLGRPFKPRELQATLQRLLSPPAPTMPTTVVASGAAVAPLSALRVLVAEDDALNQRVVLGLLARLGVEAHVVGNGLEAIEAIEHRRYDIVLTDLQMPGLDGLEAARWISRRQPLHERPALVAMTADTGARAASPQAARTFDAWLFKPLTLDAVRSTLDRLQATRQASVTVGAGSPHAPSDVDAGPTGTLPVLDMRRLDHLDALRNPDGTPLTGTLLEQYLRDAPTLLLAMHEACDAHDAALLAARAHRFLSVAQNIGATRLADRLARIEACARAQDLAAACRLVATLESEHAELATTLNGSAS